MAENCLVVTRKRLNFQKTLDWKTIGSLEGIILFLKYYQGLPCNH